MRAPGVGGALRKSFGKVASHYAQSAHSGWQSPGVAILIGWPEERKFRLAQIAVTPGPIYEALKVVEPPQRRQAAAEALTDSLEERGSVDHFASCSKWRVRSRLCQKFPERGMNAALGRSK
jgi:hypothetical protein